MFFYGKSDIGRIRKTNQDSFLTKRLANEAVLGVVCDGMGGVNGGNIASGIAVETFAAKVEDFIRRKAAAGISETQISGAIIPRFWRGLWWTPIMRFTVKRLPALTSEAWARRLSPLWL